VSNYQKGPLVIESLEKERPPVVTVDQFVRMLPAGVQSYLEAHYEDTPFLEIKKKRKN